ncbi:transglycosylase domain-containing protein [Paeniglutamicibacter psychrophenolicus]
MAAKKSPFFDTATTLGKIVAFFGVSALCGVLAAGLMVPVASLAGSGATAGAEVFDALPASFKGEPIAQPSKVLASDGSTIATFYSENRQPVKLKDISKIMQKAIVSIEDERFYEHNGVDVRGIARAAVNNFTSSSQQGASTLTQQYVNNLLVNADVVNGVDRSEMTISGTKDIADKAREAKLAISIEKEMTKDEILEGYLNLVLFSGRNYGIQAAAQRFYSVDAKDLNLQQSAMLAGMVQLPNAYNPQKYPERSLKRRNTVLAAMLRTGAIDKKAYDKAVKTKLGIKPKELKSGCIAAKDSAYFCDYVTRMVTADTAFGKTKKDRENLLYRGGLKIKTTLDPRLQKEAAKQSERMIPSDDKSNMGASIVTVEPGTGNILAMAQNKTFGPTNEDKGPITTFNFAVEKAYGGAGGFQGGSTMKPYTTMAWLEAGHNMWDRISAPKRAWPANYKWKATCLPRGYTTVLGKNGEGWNPNNAVKGYPSSMTVDYGLFNSVNTATVAEASKLDLCDIAKGTQRLGLIDYDNHKDPKTGEITNESYPISAANPSFIIGSARITPLAQATAFAAFANNGEFCENRALTSVTDAAGNDYKVKPVTCRQEISPQVVADMNGTMKKIGKKATKGQISLPIAGKTGTNNGANSTWFVGYTTGMSSAAWVGRYDKQQNLETQGKVIDGVARAWTDSGTWAAPLWTNYMKQVGTLYPAKSFGKAKAAPKPEPKKEEKDDSKSATTESSAPKDTEEKPKATETPKATESAKPKGNSGKTPTPPKKTNGD